MLDITFIKNRIQQKLGNNPMDEEFAEQIREMRNRFFKERKEREKLTKFNMVSVIYDVLDAYTIPEDKENDEDFDLLYDIIKTILLSLSYQEGYYLSKYVSEIYRDSDDGVPSYDERIEFLSKRISSYSDYDDIIEKIRDDYEELAQS